MPASAKIKDVCHYAKLQLVKKKKKRLDFALPCPALILTVFYYLCVCLCACMSFYASHACSTCRGQKRALDLLELELQLDVDVMN